MSVRYDYDPGRLELYRPRADGLMGRCACGSALIHLLVGCILFTVRFPEPKTPKRRPYRVTEVQLLPREKPQAAPPTVEVEEPKKVAEVLRPQDLSLFLNDLAPPRERQRRSRRRRSRPRVVQSARVTPPQPARDAKPEAPEVKTARVDKPGPMLPVGLPGFLERPMADVTPVDVTPSGGSASPRPEPKREQPPKREPAPEPPRETPSPVRSRPVVESPTKTEGGGDRQEPAPKPVEVARAERPRSLSEPLPRTREESRAEGPSAIPSIPVSKPEPAPVERPAELPSGRAGTGKRVAELPGNLFGEGSGLGSDPSRRDPALPEGRPGAADASGPPRPRLSRGSTGETSAAVRHGDGAGLSSLPAPGGVRLPSEERPGAVRQGSSSGLGDLGGKGTRVASLPSTGPAVSGRGSGAASSGDGAGGGFGGDAPRAFGGGERPGRPSRPSSAATIRPGDGAGRSDPGLGSGIGLGGLGPGAGGTDTRARPAGGRGTGIGLDDGDGAGKRIARAELPSTGSGAGRRGPGAGSGAGSGAGPGIASGPRDFEDEDKRRTTGGRGAGSLGLGRGRGAAEGNTDGRGVALPGGGSGGEEGPGKSGGGGEGSSLQRARTKPEGVYMSTTGNFTLPGADYKGAFRNSTALRKLMDELNTRTKVRVKIGGRYEPIARGSFDRAPVVVFTGHTRFELTDDQRQVLKEYVESGGMVWADLTRTAFDSSFRSEVEKIFGRAPATLPTGHQIYRSFYVLSGPPQGDLGNDDPFQGIVVGDRLGVVVTPNRYFSAISRSSSVSEEVKEGAIMAVVNIYMYAAGNYRAVRDAGD